MGLDALRLLLRRHSRFAIDTSVFIYHLEASSRYLPLTEAIFSSLEKPGNTAVTSTITMTELLVKPYRDSDEQQVDEFFALLSQYPNLEWIPPNLGIADLAAQFRALHRFRTPDALQAATAALVGATCFITNDLAFKRLEAFHSLVLDQYL